MSAFLFLTALSVSIDSFFCGFSLSSKKNKNNVITVLSITIVVFLMCLVTNYGVKYLAPHLDESVACYGGIILIAVGVFNLLKKDNGVTDSSLQNGIMAGFAVGLDGAMANLSLSLMGINDFTVPLFIALMHAVTISAGIALNNGVLQKKFKSADFLPPLILIALGIYKLLGLFG